MTWQVLVPVKDLRLAKSRLGLDPGARRELVLAMAGDVVAAAEAVCPGAVTIVSDDPALAEIGVPLAAGSPRGLSASVAAALRGRSDPVAVLAGDLPAATEDQLLQLLSVSEHVGWGVLADAEGAGTSVLTATRAELAQPSYGAGSFARHRSLGAADLGAGAPELPGLRRDVDTLDDLRAARALGLGERTERVLATLGFDTVHLPAS